jgi:hypothetical protein
VIIDKTLAEVYDINIGKVKKISCKARRQQENPIPRFGYPPAFTDDREAPLVSKSIRHISLSAFRKKGAFLDEIQEVSWKVLRR